MGTQFYKGGHMLPISNILNSTHVISSHHLIRPIIPSKTISFALALGRMASLPTVEMRQLVHNVLSSIEKELTVVAHSTDYRFDQRSKLMRVLETSRIKIARLLALRRWLENVPRDVHREMFSQKKSLDCSRFLRQIETIPSVISKQPIQNNNIENSVKPNSDKSHAWSRMFSAIQSLANSRSRIVRISKQSIFISTTQYSFTAKINNHNLWRLKKLDISSPPRVATNRPLLAVIVRQIDTELGKPTMSIANIENIIQTVYMSLKLADITLTLQELAPSYGFEVVRNGNLVEIVFGKSFHPGNRFRIEIMGNRVCMTSTSSYFALPAKIDGWYHWNEKWSEQAITPVDLLHQKRYLYSRNITDCDLLLVLGEIKELMAYSRVMSFWLMCQKEFRPLYVSFTHMECFCHSKTITEACVAIVIGDVANLQVKFESLTGLICLDESVWFTGSEMRLFEQFMREYQNLEIDIFLRSMWSILTARVGLSFLIGKHTNILPFAPRGFLHRKLELAYSFSPRYRLGVRFSIEQPLHVECMDVETGEVRTTESNTMLHCISKRKVFKYALETMSDTKALILFLELEHELKKMGWIVEESGRKMKISTGNLQGVIIKVNDGGYWTVCFDKSSYPFNTKSRLIISGNGFTMRMAHMIVDLITNVDFISSLLYVSKTSQHTKDCLHIIDEFTGVVQYEGRNVSMEMKPFKDIMFEMNGTTHAQVYEMFCTSVVLDTVRSAGPVIRNLHRPSPGNNIDAAIFNTSLARVFPSIVHMMEVFSPAPKVAWSVCQGQSYWSYTILLRPNIHIAMAFVLQDGDFLIRISPVLSTGPFVGLALLSLVDLKDGETGSTLEARVKPSMLETLRDRIHDALRIAMAYGGAVKMMARIHNGSFQMHVVPAPGVILSVMINREKMDVQFTSFKEVHELFENFSHAKYEWICNIRLLYLIMKFLLIENSDQLEVSIKLLHAMTKPGRIENIDWKQSLSESVISGDKVISFCVYERGIRTVTDVLPTGSVRICRDLSTE